VPPQQRVRCDDRSDLFQHLPTEHLGLDRQPAPLIVVEQNSLLSQFLPEDGILRLQVLNRLLLLAVDQSGQDQQQQLPRTQDKAHTSPGAASSCET